MNQDNTGQTKTNHNPTPQKFKSLQHKGNFKGKQKFKGFKNTTREKFQGETENLKGKIYFIGLAKQADNYNTTTEAILQYIQRTLRQGALVAQALRAAEDVDFTSLMPDPINLPESATEQQRDVATKILDRKVQKFVDAQEDYAQSKLTAYSTILGQCDKNVQSKLESRTDWNNEIINNPIKLLTAIKEITFKYKATEMRYHAALNL